MIVVLLALWEGLHLNKGSSCFGNASTKAYTAHTQSFSFTMVIEPLNAH